MDNQKAGSTLAGRLRWILADRQLRQSDFAKALGVSANYVYLLTSGKKAGISHTLAKLIEKTYGYSALWVLTGEAIGGQGEEPELKALTLELVRGLDDSGLLAVAAFIRQMEEGNG